MARHHSTNPSPAAGSSTAPASDKDRDAARADDADERPAAGSSIAPASDKDRDAARADDADEQSELDDAASGPLPDDAAAPPDRVFVLLHDFVAEVRRAKVLSSAGDTVAAELETYLAGMIDDD